MRRRITGENSVIKFVQLVVIIRHVIKEMVCVYWGVMLGFGEAVVIWFVQRGVKI